MKEIKEHIKKYHEGLITQHELNLKLDEGFGNGIHGGYHNEQYIGYDYHNQEWIIFKM